MQNVADSLAMEEARSLSSTRSVTLVATRDRSLSQTRTIIGKRLAQGAFCLDRKGVGYDFELAPEPVHAFEIYIFRSVPWVE